jgi:hypothetical protein
MKGKHTMATWHELQMREVLTVVSQMTHFLKTPATVIPMEDDALESSRCIWKGSDGQPLAILDLPDVDGKPLLEWYQEVLPDTEAVIITSFAEQYGFKVEYLD